jgi:hypothetical protein
MDGGVLGVLASHLLPEFAMLVDGLCRNGHPLLCVMNGGRIRGVYARGALRGTCPQCGVALVEHKPESGIVAVPGEFRARAKSGTDEA